MKESDYILAANVARIDAVKTIVMSISPDSSVPKEEWREVLTILGKWRDDYSKRLEAE